MERDRLQQLLPRSSRGELPAHYRRNGQSHSDPIWDSKARVTSRHRLAASSKTPLRKGMVDPPAIMDRQLHHINPEGCAITLMSQYLGDYQGHSVFSHNSQINRENIWRNREANANTSEFLRGNH